MLERVHRVKGIGLLHDADAKSYGLKKASFIYADNGLGKSTLASIFHSCSVNNSDLIINRRTINGLNDPEVVLQFSNGEKSNFQNGSWDHCRPELLVFDADFVEKNVYAGGEVTASQRKNLLHFVLGESAVVAQSEYDQADDYARTTAALVRDTTNQLSGVHRGLTLPEFQALEEVPDAGDQITALNEVIVEAQNIDLIQAKALPKELGSPIFDIEPIFKILSTSLASIDLAAEKQVKAHLNEHKKPNLEKWISDGYAYGDKKICLFCSQPLEGVQLIQAYRSYFNLDYNQLKLSVSGLGKLILTISSDSVIDQLKTSFATASAVIDGWQEHVEISPPIFDEATGRATIEDVRIYLEGLMQAKESQLLDGIGSEDNKEEVFEKWQLILNIIENCNQSIASAVQQITDHKKNLAGVDISSLQDRIIDLEWAEARHGQDVVDLFSQLSQAQAQDAIAKTDKQAKKDALNQIMQATLESYKGRINELLKNFGAQFAIPNIDYNYRGGLSSDYVLQMRNSNIALSGGVPDFKTSLSESDKRILAFAFFIASAESDPDLVSRIVIIDDPVCSLDLNRKQQTRTVLKRIHDNCEQLIVLSHDVHFMRNIRDDVLRTAPPNDVKCMKLKSVANRYSDFDDINLDQECESAYFKCHRILSEFIAGNAPSSMEVAKSIRPMMEGYLHRRFPGRINQRLVFGGVISSINDSENPSPLVHAKNIINELSEINQYAGQFHHDTNPSVDQVQITDGELRSFVERTINVVYSGLP